MTDPNAVLQHILAAVEQIKASQTTLQQSHELQSQFGLEARSGGEVRCPVPVTGPEADRASPRDRLRRGVAAPRRPPQLAEHDRLYAQGLGRSDPPHTHRVAQHAVMFVSCNAAHIRKDFLAKKK